MANSFFLTVPFFQLPKYFSAKGFASAALISPTIIT